MKVMDIKPAPKTNLEAWDHWLNWIQTQFYQRPWASGKRKIEVKICS